MASSKFLTLGGLGASATAAVAGPGATLSGGASGPSLGYKSTLFEGVTENATNLYLTFALECTKKIFSNLGNPESIKGLVSGSAEGSKFQLPSSPSTGEVTGCLKLDLKHYKDTASKKGNVVATIELAASKGDYGIILLNSITNMLKNGGFGFDYRALFLKKEKDKWEIKAGVQWADTLYMDAGKPIQTKWTLPHRNTAIDEIFWKNNLCKFSESCEAQLKEKTEGKEHETYEWKKAAGQKNIWQGIQIEDPAGPDSNGYESDFWNGKDTPLAVNSTAAYKPTAIFVGGQWTTSGTILSGNVSSLQKGFDIFKGDKGEWEKITK